MKAKFTIGIDEAGRGPLAGPVAVGVFAVRSKSALKRFKGVRDSKKLSEASREAFFFKIKLAKNEGHAHYAVSFSSAGVIDSKGLAPAIRSALNRSLKKLEKLGIMPRQCRVLLDGSLKAPARYSNQKTIIGGDDIETIISLASICAKVLRDRKMARLAQKYPKYGFEAHKGYGTKAHYKAIKKHGLSREHRRSFLNLHKSDK